MPNCAYPDSYAWSFTPALTEVQDNFSKVSSSSSIFGVHTINIHNEGLYTFTYVLTKTGYASAYGMSSFTKSFNINLENPCRTTILKPAF